MVEDRNPQDFGELVPEMTPLELRERMSEDSVEDPGLVLVDVREGFERRIADLPQWGQRHIPLNEFLDRIGEFDSGDEIVIYCRSGRRSGWAVQQLVDRGFSEVWNLRGGILGWREEVDPSIQAY